MADHILEVRGLSKSFGGFVAVRGVDLGIERGRIHALIGPNGAGKTTVFNLLTKFHTPSAGPDRLRGARHHALEAGGDRQSRHHPLVPDLRRLPAPDGPAERAGCASAPPGVSYRFWQSDRVLEQLHDEAMDKLASVGLREFADTRAVSLAYGRKRALEIATTLALDPKLMLLDEPTQGMGTEDVGRVTDLIREVSAGRSILMVEHNLGVVSRLADTITVLNRGEILAEGPYEAVSRDPAVMEAYMGTTPEEMAEA